jgi:hypothetical protein
MLRPLLERGVLVDLTELEEQPGGRAAAAVFRNNAAGWGHAVVDAAYADERRTYLWFSILQPHPESATRGEED